MLLLCGILWGLFLDSLDGAFGLADGALTAFTAGLLLAGCLVAGYEEHRLRGGGRAPVFDSATAHVGFWTLHYLFAWLALAAFGQADLPGVTPPLSKAVAGLGLAATTAVVFRRDWVSPAFDPRVWVRQFRAGKRDALSN
jgi:hypothetical protein